ncbi:UDP-N-acetylglucosamine 2-epimerase [Marinobacter sp.]|jgi:GDP/UDP-N,N'-diacetylbacillosamine 2-epimerase (hydrolysing)|uniref:UDP-N-acetylglucosamine 2-epimerase n=1 Tax=Marinobacter sp. TaxID=50741 RepID=UPI000C40570E|nr:UDP-N-acetylglucosamine 2-epimerase [Marinobacter sp.]MAB50717.1 UDP-N-acetylglucosamine 2-epimerase (hydrolyzing) [Marinobacter sp.]MBN15325.1 UDP-N-acetylglucosamine 2-epimerase (hydrolyzing) [Pelagibacterium sp.]|tara:strand:- start:1242 stop:2414 length:1173 start_codon:yes stop_codon:yes gene_type:complete
MNRKVCVVTGTRSEFGLLRWLMDEIAQHAQLDLQVAVTGMHLSPEFGSTYHEIESAGFAIDAKVEMLLSADSETAITKSMGLGMIGFADAYERLHPDIVVVLGDRFEIFAATSAALIAGIPVAHLHGGETTEGAFDEAIRHSITKMSHLHFVAAEEYRNRVLQLGEYPERIFNVGGMGIDAIKRVRLLDRKGLEESIDFQLGDKNLLITFHPVTLESQVSSTDQMQALLDALAELSDTHLIFTMPNADTGGRELTRMVREFVDGRDNASVYTSLGQLRYFSCLAEVDGVIGNSSSGLLEAPAFQIGTVNIGDRQRGRLKADSVIDCEPSKTAILKAINTLYTPDFKSSLHALSNPYGNGGASKSIVKILADYPLDGLLKKSFYNLPVVGQ